jgi:HemY protein
MRAARWALEDRDARTALQRLASLPQGAARRTLALRIKLKASRHAHQTQEALDTARLLGKHRAFSAAAAQSIVRGLATELIRRGARPRAAAIKSGNRSKTASAPCRNWPSTLRSA